MSSRATATYDPLQSVGQAESGRSTSDKLSYEQIVESAARVRLHWVLDKIAPLGIELIASMHGPTVRAYVHELVRASANRPLVRHEDDRPIPTSALGVDLIVPQRITRTAQSMNQDWSLPVFEQTRCAPLT